MPFFEGLVIGLSLAFLIGPVFFTLLNASLRHGIFAGLSVAFGIFLSDISCVLICYFGIAKYLQEPRHQAYVAFGGGLLLLGMGLKYLIKPNVKVNENDKVGSRHYITYILKGYAVNILNPAVFAIWIGIIGIGTSKFALSNGLIIFLAGVLAGIFSTDSLKALLAHKIKPLIKANILIWLFRIIGISLAGFGLRLVYFGLMYLMK